MTYNPDCNSKYAPDVLTISSGELFPDSILKLKGEQLQSDGTTRNNKIPWRGHNTSYWGSQGCITGQTKNQNGDYTDLVNFLKDNGITKKYDIPCTFGLGEY